MLNKKHTKPNDILFIFFALLFLQACGDNTQHSNRKSYSSNTDTNVQDTFSNEILTQEISDNTFSEQESSLYFTTASSGLLVRAAPNIDSKKIGKLPYGSIVRLIEETKISHSTVDNGHKIEGYWVKIKSENAPYKITEINHDQFQLDGYIFNGFIEKLHKASIEIKTIDSLKFQRLYQAPSPSKFTKITSQKKVEHLLSSKLTWKNSDMVQGRIIDQIKLNERQTLDFLPDDLSFIAYYPDEEILLFEGGHGSEFSISIKTGESLETVGNPEYIISSPNEEFRLNGWFPGQECSNYFFQKKSGDKYIYLVDFGWGSEKYGKDVCYFNQFCWLNDGTFIFSYTDHSGENSQEAYCEGQLILE